MANKQQQEKEYNRKAQLSSYLYDVSKLLISGVGIGGLSPLITGTEMVLYNYICVAIGALAAILFAYCANKILKTKQ